MQYPFQPTAIETIEYHAEQQEEKKTEIENNDSLEEIDIN